MATNLWRSVVCVLAVLLTLLAIAQLPHVSHFVEKILNKFLIWVSKDVGPWGPIILALAYIPCTVLAIPASILTLGGGYLFGLMLGFLTDSVGSTMGATAAFWVGRTVSLNFSVILYLSSHHAWCRICLVHFVCKFCVIVYSGICALGTSS